MLVCAIIFVVMTEREEEVFERKENKKDKGYVAFRSDDDSVGEEEGEDLRLKFVQNLKMKPYLNLEM